MKKRTFLLCEGTIDNNINSIKRYSLQTNIGAATNTEYLFYGTVNKETFLLTPTSYVKNSFLPSLEGKFFTNEKNQTILDVKVKPHPLLLGFSTVASCHLFILEILLVVLKFIFTEPIPTKALIVPLFICFILFAFVAGGCFANKKKTLEKLQLILFREDNIG